MRTKKEKRTLLFFIQPKISPVSLAIMEQMTGIEPAYLAWEASALPLSYICNIFYNYTPSFGKNQPQKSKNIDKIHTRR